MPTNNILLFDQNKGNMMGDTEYNTNQQRLNGVQSGIASSQLQNKFQYQVSLIAYAIASLMYNNGLDANDADAVSAFVSNLSGTLVQKVLDKASTSEAQAGTVDTKWMSPALVKAAIDFTLANPLTISGNTTFTGTVSGPTPTLDSHLTPKSYVDGLKKYAIISQGSKSYSKGTHTIASNLNFSNYNFIIFSITFTAVERDTSYYTTLRLGGSDIITHHSYNQSEKLSLFTIANNANNMLNIQTIYGGDNNYSFNFLTFTNANYNLAIYLSSEASTSRAISWYVYGFLK